MINNPFKLYEELGSYEQVVFFVLKEYSQGRVDEFAKTEMQSGIGTNGIGAG